MLRGRASNLDTRLHGTTAEDVIANARVAIAKAQTLIQDHELKLAIKKKVKELEATRHQVQKELADHSSKLETLRAQLASKPFYQKRS